MVLFSVQYLLLFELVTRFVRTVASTVISFYVFNFEIYLYKAEFGCVPGYVVYLYKAEFGCVPGYVVSD